MEDYKEKLRLAKEALDSGSYDKETIEYIFPELKENDDERIKNFMIKVFKSYQNPSYHINTDKWEGMEISKILSWLEKQGEQKPTWSEEDEEMIESCLDELEEVNGLLYTYIHNKNAKLGEIINWLKSLKERMKGE